MKRKATDQSMWLKCGLWKICISLNRQLRLLDCMVLVVKKHDEC